MEMFIFNDDEWNVTIKPEVLLLKPFRSVWDKYKDKELALIELAYVYFIADYESDFSDIAEIKERKVAALQSLNRGDELNIDDITDEAIRYYEELNQTTATMLLSDMKYSILKLRNYFREVDLLEEVGDSGRLKHDISKLTSAIKSAPSIIKSLNDLEEEVKKGLEQSSNIKGGKTKGIYED